MTEGVTRFTVRRAHVLVDALRATSKVLLLYMLQTIIPVHNPTSISIDEMHQGWPDVEVLEELLMNTPPNNMVSHIAVAFAAHLERSAESDYQTPLCTCGKFPSPISCTKTMNFLREKRRIQVDQTS